MSMMSPLRTVRVAVNISFIFLSEFQIYISSHCMSKTGLEKGY